MGDEKEIDRERDGQIEEGIENTSCID